MFIFLLNFEEFLIASIAFVATVDSALLDFLILFLCVILSIFSLFFCSSIHSLNITSHKIFFSLYSSSLTIKFVVSLSSKSSNSSSCSGYSVDYFVKFKSKIKNKNKFLKLKTKIPGVNFF